MRAVALDLGKRRIGVAVSDSEGRLATPYDTVERSGDDALDRSRLAALVAEVGAGVVVVGLPLSGDGSEGPAAAWARAEAAALAEAFDVPVELHDERFTTVSANRSLGSAGVGSRRRRRVVDQVAATVLLESWLEAARQRANERGTTAR